VRELVHARHAHTELFRRDEGVLLDAAVGLQVRDLRRALDYWRQAADTAAAFEDGEAAYRRRRLHVSETFEGTVRIDGELDPESGDVVLTAIAALAEPAGREQDDRSPAQRRADALTDICRDFLDHGEAPARNGERPQVTVIVDLETLERRAPGRCELGDGHIIEAETARRWACDAGISRIITRGRSLPLDVGRRTRTIPTWIRRALVIRDGGCTWAGCDRPTRWCDAHHVIHWLDGGDTALDNLRLLCRRHHRAMHAADRGPP